jgi:hypothetical protein
VDAPQVKTSKPERAEILAGLSLVAGAIRRTHNYSIIGANRLTLPVLSFPFLKQKPTPEPISLLLGFRCPQTRN